MALTCCCCCLTMCLIAIHQGSTVLAYIVFGCAFKGTRWSDIIHMIRYMTLKYIYYQKSTLNSVCVLYYTCNGYILILKFTWCASRTKYTTWGPINHWQWYPIRMKDINGLKIYGLMWTWPCTVNVQYDGATGPNIYMLHMTSYLPVSG